MAAPESVHAWAPGRVNLIGEHTDYTGGLALPMAIQLGTTITGVALAGRLRLRSDQDRAPLDVPLPVDEPGSVVPAWGRYPAAVAAELGATKGIDAAVVSTVPIGAGLSSSASLEIAVALALGADERGLELAQLGQRAEHRASGVPCGIIDQLSSVAGVAGHALLIDCDTLLVRPVPIPDSVQFVVVHSGEHRSLETSAYAERRRSAEEATRLLGPLTAVRLSDAASIEDALIARRARHIISENQRVRDFATMMADEDLGAAGALMAASHRSLRVDYEVSTPRLDALVEDLASMRGVYGARLTGAGFGGCVIALCEPGTEIDGGWIVEASDGARLL
jgi:galactokinase